MKKISDIKQMLAKKFSRRDLIKLSLAGFIALIANNWLSRLVFSQSAKANFSGRNKKGVKGLHDLVMVRGDSPDAITRRAIKLSLSHT